MTKSLGGGDDDAGWRSGSRLGALVTASWVQALLGGDPNLSILDVRGEVRQTKVEDDVSHVFTEYVGLQGDNVDGHVPGAVFIDWVKVGVLLLPPLLLILLLLLLLLLPPLLLILLVGLAR